MATNSYAFNFSQYISVKNVSTIKANVKTINISDFRKLLRNWYNIAAGQNSFLLPKGHYIYTADGNKHADTFANLIYYILKHNHSISTNINLSNKHSENALYIAEQRQMYKVIAILLKAGVKRNFH